MDAAAQDADDRAVAEGYGVLTEHENGKSERQNIIYAFEAIVLILY